MASSSSRPSGTGYLQAPNASPSFAQTTAEFSLDSDLGSDLDLDEHDDDRDDLRLREAELAGGEAFELGKMGAGSSASSRGQRLYGRKNDSAIEDDEDGDEDEDSDGWIRAGGRGHSGSAGGGSGASGQRRASISTVASFQLYTPDEEQAVVRKFDRRLVLFVALLFMLSFLDRSNIGNAAIAGMEEDLQTDPPWDGWYSWALTAFYISYIAFEWMSLLWKIIPAHVYISMIVLSWGIIASLQAVAVSYPMLIGLRVFLGIGEAAFTGVPFYLSFFFKRDELAYRTAVFISAAPLATSFASTLAWVIVKFGQSSPIAPWRLLFLVEGFPSVLVSVIAWRIIPDSPQSARYLTRRERKVARLRLRNEKAQHQPNKLAAPSNLPAISPSVSTFNHNPGGKNQTAANGLRYREVLAVLRDPLAWLTAAIFFLTNLSYSSLPVFLPKVLKEMGHDRLAAQAMCAPPYLLAFLAVLLTAHVSDRRRARSLPMIVHALASAAGYALLALAEPLDLSPTVRYLAVYPATVGFFNVVTLIITWSLNNQASESRQGGGFALMQLIGQCGPLVGTRLYPERDAPYFAPGMQVCAGAMLTVAVLALVMRLYMQYLNKKMDREQGSGRVTAVAVGESAEEEEGLVGGPGARRGRSKVVDRFRYML